MMCVADEYVIVCLDTIDDKNERKMLEQTILNSGKEIIEITEEQKGRFAGNMLQIQGNEAYFGYVIFSLQ